MGQACCGEVEAPEGGSKPIVPRNWGPGEYVTTDQVAITPRPELSDNHNNKIIATLHQPGIPIRVTEVVQCNERLRAKIDQPQEGWLSLQNLKTGDEWVTPRRAVHTDVASANKSDEPVDSGFANVMPGYISLDDPRVKELSERTRMSGFASRAVLQQVDGDVWAGIELLYSQPQIRKEAEKEDSPLHKRSSQRASNEIGTGDPRVNELAERAVLSPQASVAILRCMNWDVNAAMEALHKDPNLRGMAVKPYAEIAVNLRLMSTHPDSNVNVFGVDKAMVQAVLKLDQQIRVTCRASNASDQGTVMDCLERLGWDPTA